jgi:hypothetical protein
MSKRTDETLISTMWGVVDSASAPDDTANEPRRETAAEEGSDEAGVGSADIWKASLVKTDMVVVVG